MIANLSVAISRAPKAAGVRRMMKRLMAKTSDSAGCNAGA
jgi:hypothetical protein